MDLISIIIPVYNGVKTIGETLESINQQSWKNIELIIVNDGSEDGTEDFLLNYFKQTSVSYPYSISKQKNKGAPAARNRGFAQSRGNYLLFCDADAVLKKDALEKMFNCLKENPSASYCYSSFYWGRKLFKLWPFDAERLKRMPYIHTMALIRREDFTAKTWDESIKKLQDWDLWLTMLEEGKRGVFWNEALFFIKPGGTISSWLPSWTYKLFPHLKTVKKYKEAEAIIKKKHNL